MADRDDDAAFGLVAVAILLLMLLSGRWQPLAYGAVIIGLVWLVRRVIK
jgi:asparagine N-glycosylation enzyme membrane subunit Stt3